MYFYPLTSFHALEECIINRDVCIQFNLLQIYFIQKLSAYLSCKVVVFVVEVYVDAVAYEWGAQVCSMWAPILGLCWPRGGRG